jgi:GT2 family glycosyltransferase/lipopolysaccharide/colanic/teichoic acid biosynthesis glycosyltransferase
VDVSIIIVSYNSFDVLKACLEAVRETEFSGQAEVIVVDNASVDGTPEMVRTEYPWVVLIAGRENLGYSKGVNVGIRQASGRYFFILNPDTVVRRDSLQKLTNFMDNTPEAGIAAPKLVFYDGNVQLSCRRFYTFKVLLLRRTPLGKIFRNSKAVRDHLMLDFDHDSTTEVDWMLGAAMFVRREAVESVGLMDERFFLYFEDVDWCYRMKQHGWKVFYHPDVVVTHGYARDSAQSVLNRSFIAHLVSLFRYYEKWNKVWYYLKKYREVAKVVLFLLVDLVAFNAAFLSAYYLRLVLDGIFTNPIFPISAYDRFLFFENLLFIFSFFAVGLYRIRRETRPVDELFDITKAIVFAAILLMTSTYLGKVRTYSRMVVAFVVPFSILYDWGLRSLIRHIHRTLLSLKVDLKRCCIVGPLDKAKELELRLMRDDQLGLDAVGVVDTEGSIDSILTGTLGSADDLEGIVDKYRIQEVIVLPGAVPDERLTEFVTMGRRRVVDVTLLTDYAGLVFHQATVSDLSGRPVIRYARDTRYAVDRFLKRLTDILFSGIFVVASAVFYVLYSLYAMSKGRRPFTYSDRLGLEGEPITIPTAGDGWSDGPSDFVNLPLFWLVFVGKMSMVGPYPLEADDSSELVAGDRFRFEVRPGITGYWRAGTRRAISIGDLLAQDANYIRNWSLTQDVKIFLTSFVNVLYGRKRTLKVSDGRTGLPLERKPSADADENSLWRT